MEKFVLIDIAKIKAKVFDRRVERKIKYANRQAKLTGYRYLVVLFGGRLQVWQKRELNNLIKQKAFKKGTTIEVLEASALYKTPLRATKKKEDGKGQGA